MTYNEFINNILNSRGRFGIPEGVYKERHHIIPHCMNGTNDENNLIDLYAKEHFIAHKLLALENPDNYGCIYGWSMMAFRKSNNQDRYYEITADEYEQLKILMAKTNGDFQKMLWQDPNYKEKMSNIRKGIPKSEEHKRKIGEGNKGKQLSKETKEKISKKNKGRKRTEEVKKRISEATKGSNNGMFGKTHSQEVRDAQSKRAHEQHKNSKWWNNGEKQVFQEECPNGFISGRLPFKEGHKIGKYNHTKGIKKHKNKYMDKDGNIYEMDSSNKNRWHSDWILIDE